MAGKHDQLTTQELDEYEIPAELLAGIHGLVRNRPRHEINILDWGCGRGRAVAKLRAAGFNAFGIDIDERVMLNGHQLFNDRGLDPHALLRAADDLKCFPDGFFHCIISDQVMEHLPDLEAVLREMARLTAVGGLGLHCFPGAKMLIEVHVNMPLVHWLPRNRVRKPVLLASLLAGWGPRQEWPEASGLGYFGKIETYYRYLDNKTHYRDIRNILDCASKAGFHAQSRLLTALPGQIPSWIPESLRVNGFPRSTHFLELTRI